MKNTAHHLTVVYISQVCHLDYTQTHTCTLTMYAHTHTHTVTHTIIRQCAPMRLLQLILYRLIVVESLALIMGRDNTHLFRTKLYVQYSYTWH